MPELVAKRSNFVNTFFLKRSKKIKPHAGSKAADEHLKNLTPQVTSLTVFD
jgi:hypothetical protein